VPPHRHNSEILLLNGDAADIYGTDQGIWLIKRRTDPVRVLAHRGGRGPWRENTSEAFAGARDSRADGVEIDVRRCADGTLAVLHDPAIPGVGQVSDIGHSDLPLWVPTLEIALEACSGLIVDVEIKNNPWEPGYDEDQRVAAEVVDAIQRFATGTTPTNTAIFVSAFWHETLSRVREAAFSRGVELPVALLVAGGSNPPSGDARHGDAGRGAADASELASRLGFQGLNPHYRLVTPSLVRRAHDLGLSVWTWTVNEPETVLAVGEAGVDGIISDEVEVVRTTLAL